MQDFVNQAESLIHEDGLRETIIDNAKTFIETEYNETVEHEEYAKLATEMCKGYITKREEVTENAEDQPDTAVEHKPKVRFQVVEKRKTKIATQDDSGFKNAPDATEEAPGNEDQSTTSEEPNQVVENETSHKNLKMKLRIKNLKTMQTRRSQLQEASSQRLPLPLTSYHLTTKKKSPNTPRLSRNQTPRQRKTIDRLRAPTVVRIRQRKRSTA